MSRAASSWCGDPDQRRAEPAGGGKTGSAAAAPGLWTATASDPALDSTDDLVRGIVHRTGLGEGVAQMIVDLVLDHLRRALLARHRVQLAPLGVWRVQPRMPATTWVDGQRTVTPRPDVVSFRPAPRLTAQVNRDESGPDGPA
ncbi:HU family DNA-binding protein [Deinococcus multiflagellatus]|uniref:HU family DNA-binding protein n=1 Tax=Deinococcus multiflagellatus TaxID=1656887 RepID=A0ABW1ZS44_9DEIO|nr:HU family DNA-binding protein [Deinococcus multiflagellatus]MBZ9714496.1 HU family DNA-binding protein [Deinococcus multiflagellatus]